MSFINWNNSSDHLEAIRRREEEAIYEQAVRIKLAKMAAASGGGSLDDGYFQPGYVIAGYTQQNNE